MAQRRRRIHELVLLVRRGLRVLGNDGRARVAYFAGDTRIALVIRRRRPPVPHARPCRRLLRLPTPLAHFAFILLYCRNRIPLSPSLTRVVSHGGLTPGLRAETGALMRGARCQGPTPRARRASMTSLRWSVPGPTPLAERETRGRTASRRKAARGVTKPRCSRQCYSAPDPRRWIGVYAYMVPEIRNAPGGARKDARARPSLRLCEGHESDTKTVEWRTSLSSLRS